MIEFIDEGHIYLKDGIIVPSVTEIVSFIFPDKYKNVPKWILDKKAEYGTIVHLAVETYEKDEEMPELNTYQSVSFQQYLEIKKENRIKVLFQEEIVSYKYEFAGRLDMIAIVNSEYSLLDIKTTEELDEEYLSWQLSLYEYAIGENFEQLYCLWLPKGKLAKLVKIKRKTEKEIKEILGEFKKWKNLM